MIVFFNVPPNKSLSQRRLALAVPHSRATSLNRRG